MSVRAARILGAALLGCLVLAGGARAFPDRPITIVLPYSPGSAADSYGRALGEHFTRVLGQSVVIVNRDGGSGVVGMRFVATSPPDGHTLGLTPMTAIVVQPHLVRNTGTEPANFAPICGTNENVLGVVVRADNPIRDLTGLVAEGKRRAMSFGSPGPNSLPQLAMFRVQRATGVEFNHIPFRGDPPHLNEVLAGRLDFSAVVVSSASGLLDSGRLRLLAVFSDRRHPDYPDVPTAREQGIDALQYSPVGLYAPAGTPEPVLAQLEEACRSGVQEEGFLRVAKQLRLVVDYKSRADFTRLIRSEYEVYGPMMRALGVTPD
ncbi:Bug family tripartite tricarboxylate transporter substrate binding protein [Pararoseomonas indoligenes]|uniref:Tripartite tricarboxylate transporter substrate binding protein n=1 Tax=Roseomonas indoligenes TaxID=2820811 RepID=A0A940MYV7_9PROT|nr:tripartite tricarboxylate transporter substrate binding protein [Pararoseomonas indoligenes]MBP0493590.1 tripartite tricarboxylate transporter substrate binding protein [Pararoseomonas indoligenes]